MSAAEVQSAQSVVALATKEQQTANARILAHPRVNHKESKNATSLVDMDPEYTVPEPTKADYRPANASVRAAAALVAEYEARNGLMEFTWPLDFDRSSSSTISNVTTGPFLGKRAASSYWYADISPKGKSPFHPKASSYVVYKNVIADCGAKGNGVADDTKAIQDCIAAQDRCGGDSLTCASTSVMPLVLYFPLSPLVTPCAVCPAQSPLLYPFLLLEIVCCWSTLRDPKQP